MDFSFIEKNIGYAFKNKSLLKRALTLSSASEDNNERLEFFGDSVIQLVVSEKLFLDGGDEGVMTERRQSVASAEGLERASKRLGLDKVLIKGKGDTNNQKAISSVYEAVTAAIYMDGGFEEAKKFVLQTADFTYKKSNKNYKGELQEWLQAKGEGLPEYQRENIGTPQNPQFVATLKIFGKALFAKGKSVREAEQAVAKKALSLLNKK